MGGAASKKKKVSYRGRTKPVPVPAVRERQAEVTAENLRAFLNRDWELIRRSKDASMERAVRERGTTFAFRLLQDLVDTALFWGWDPRTHDRSEDLAAHVALKEKLSRTARRRPVPR